MSRLRLDNFTHLLIIGGNDNKKLSIPTKNLENIATIQQLCSRESKREMHLSVLHFKINI